ncbi:MAG: hypothetical protein R2806_12035 [Saprospiraceae bacterium]
MNARSCGFQIAILNNGGNQFKVHHNDITSSDIWFTNEVADAYVVIMNGNSCTASVIPFAKVYWHLGVCQRRYLYGK